MLVHKAPKAIDMRLNGLKFQHAQYQFEFLLWRGHENRAKYPKNIILQRIMSICGESMLLMCYHSKKWAHVEQHSR